MTEKRPKIVAVVGPTASGKSDFAVLLAKKWNGEVISADSRQVYRGMDIGTGKITKKEMRGVPHHLLDIASPKRTYSAAQWQRDADRAIKNILTRGHLPIICGGTGFYIQTITEGLQLPDVKPNPLLRKSLAKKTAGELFVMLQEKDPSRAASIDSANPVRLIRAIEIATALGGVPPITTLPRYETLSLGIKIENEELRDRIHLRLIKRMRHGMLAEVKRLREEGVSWKRMEEMGLEYRYLSRFCIGKLDKEAMFTQLEQEIVHYAKRQLTWLKRDTRIHWIARTDITQAHHLIGEFLSRK